MTDGIRHLLEYANKQKAIGREATSAELHSIAEVIDCEMRSLKDERDHWMELAHQWEAGASARRFAERLEAAASERADVTLFGVDYTPLPVDADGEAIHVGDVMELDSGAVEEVESMHYYGSGGWTTTTTHNATAMPSIIRHHHAPTVEDVLREFAEKIIDSQIPSMHPTYEEAIAEYAAKLRLAEGVDE